MIKNRDVRYIKAVIRDLRNNHEEKKKTSKEKKKKRETKENVMNEKMNT